MLELPVSEHLNSQVSYTERQVLERVDWAAKEWMRISLFTYGGIIGTEKPPSFADTSLHYCQGYGCTDIQLMPPHRPHSSCYTFRLFYRDEFKYLRPDIVLQIHAQVASIVQDYFPGAKWTSFFAVCAQCLQEDKLSTNQRVLPWGGCVRVCTLFDGALMCRAHKNIAEKTRYEQLRIESASQQTPQQVERQKMSSALRFSILQRDNFTCQACGQSPRKGHAIALHVDHILPIAKGGKTENENLHALCENCNSGKRDKIIPELLLEIGKD